MRDGNSNTLSKLAIMFSIICRLEQEYSSIPPIHNLRLKCMSQDTLKTVLGLV